MPDPSLPNIPDNPTPLKLELPNVPGSNPDQEPLRYLVDEQVLALVKAIDSAHPDIPEREQILQHAHDVFVALVQNGHEMVVCDLKCDKGAASARPRERFHIASVLCELLPQDHLRLYHRKALDQLTSACRAEVVEAIAGVQSSLAKRSPAERDAIISKFLDSVCVTGKELRGWVRESLLGSPARVAATMQEAIVGSLVSYLEEREKTLRTRAVVSVLSDLIDGELHPTDRALDEVQKLCRASEALFLSLVVKERRATRVPGLMTRATEDEWGMGQLVQLSSMVLWCVLSKNMRASAAGQVGLALASLGRQGRMQKAVDLLARLVKVSRCDLSLHDERMPEPLGRAAYIGAVRQSAPKGPLGNTTHGLVVKVPESPYVWDYVGQRLSYLSGISDAGTRESRILPYLVSLREYFASAEFYRREEAYFRQLHLEGRTSRELEGFYSDIYQIEGPLGKVGTVEAERPRRDTAVAFRTLAAGRYGLNVRALYARSFAGQPWLLQDMATQLQGTSERLRVVNREAYPGPGVRISDLRVGNAIDLSTRQSRQKYLKDAPWLRTAMKVDGQFDYYFFRGFELITRSFKAAARPISTLWRKAGSFGAEPYAAILFNDHFHNDRLPEVRMWLVPECVVHRKLALALENGVDINRLDCTPEGFAEDAKALGLTIFNVGASGSYWGSFAHAWPFGEGPVYSWETYSGWAKTVWQSPQHIHLALSREDYQEIITARVLKWIMKAREEHARINKRVRFFLDLHSSFLTMEEAWAKDFANAEEGPARMERSDGSQGAAGEPQKDGEQLLEDELDLTPRRSHTRLLQHFLTIRNEIARTNPQATFKDFPVLELQYTRLFTQQAGTFSLSGADMALYDAAGRRRPIFNGPRGERQVVQGDVEIDERLEAAWVQWFESQFAPGNIPRIRMP